MMNNLKGEGSLLVDGCQWTLCLDFNALCCLEDALGKSAMEFFSDFEGGRFPSMRELRQLCYVMLQRHHPDATLEDAGDIMSSDTAGVLRIMNSALPDEPEGGRRAPGKRKRKAHNRP